MGGINQIAKIAKDAKTFFESVAVGNYISKMVKIVTKKYSKKTVSIRIEYDKKSEDFAYTDYNEIFVNAANEIVEASQNMIEKLLIVTGFIAHELAHVIYSAPNAKRKNIEAIKKATFYPRVPEDFSRPSFQKNMLEIIQYMKTDNLFCYAFVQITNDFQNLYEDGYIEGRFLKEFMGKLAAGLRRVRSLHWLQFQTVKELRKSLKAEEFNRFTALRVLLFQYAKYGKYKFNSAKELNDDLVKEANLAMKYVDKLMASDNSADRQYYVNCILVSIWPTIKEYYESIKPDGEDSEGIILDFGEPTSQTKDAKRSSQLAPEGEPNGESSEDINDETKKALKQLMEMLSKENSDSSDSDQNENSSEKASNEGNDNKQNSKDKPVNMDIPDACETFEELEAKLTHEEDTMGDIDELTNDMDKLITDISDEIAKEQAEIDRTQDLNHDEKLKTTSAHNHIPMTIKRLPKVDTQVMNAYNTYAKPLERISQILQDSIIDKLEDRRKIIEKRNLYFGNRLDMDAIARDNLGIFTLSKYPNNLPSIVVTLLIDESGSMQGGRIEAAKKTAIILYDFCVSLGFPVIIYGHTADEDMSNSVSLRSYAEFDNIDSNDKYRLMNISARNNNRDGAALEYMYKKLDERTEDIKLFFIISDGKPNASGYGGNSAMRDMMATVDKYNEKDIKTIAAAIGSDKDVIHKIYGDGFLDITDLTQLPKLLTDIIVSELDL